MVDFIGAKYEPQEVIAAALPKLRDLRRTGCRTLVDCTPAYLGRDVKILARLSKAAGLHIVTNTGYYGAANDKYVPPEAYRQTPEQIAAVWIAEARDGIEGTGIRPGFIKTGVDRGPLSEIDRKLIVASALCHRETGLRIAAHTGDGAAAMDILRTLAGHQIGADAYVWVHAQNEKNRAVQVEAAKAGAWIEFDGVGPKSLDAHLTAVVEMIEAGFIGQLLVSQDSGWFHVGEPGGGQFNGYTFLFDKFIPALRRRGVTERQVRQLVEENPARALALGGVKS
jgi:phosphotriesterase-related protein